VKKNKITLDDGKLFYAGIEITPIENKVEEKKNKNRSHFASNSAAFFTEEKRFFPLENAMPNNASQVQGLESADSNPRPRKKTKF